MRGVLLFCFFCCGFLTKLNADDIKIAVCGPFTEKDTEVGQMTQRGLNLKLSELKKRGGLYARLKLVYKDDAGDVSEARRVALEVVQDKSIVAVIGHLHNECSLAALEIYKKAKLVALSPGSTNVDLCESSPFYFRNIYCNDYQGRFAAHYIGEVLGLKKVALVSDNNAYGQDLRRHFLAEAKRREIDVLTEEIYDSNLNNDFSSMVKKFRFKQPQIIFVAGYYGHAGMLVKAMKEANVSVRIMGGDALFDKKFIELGGQEAEGALIVTPFVSDPVFTKAFQEKYPGSLPNARAALAYDALGLLADAINRVEAKPKALRQELSEMVSSRMGYQGITGNTFFDSHGDCLRPAVVAEVKNGTFVKASGQLTIETKVEEVDEFATIVANKEKEKKEIDAKENKAPEPQQEVETKTKELSTNEILIGIIVVLSVIILLLVIRKPTN